MIIFIDMDGVLVNFVDGVLRLFHRETLMDNWPDGATNVQKVLKIKRSEMWAAIDDLGACFWRNLETYPWAGDLVHGCQELGEVVLISSPSLASPLCLAGKKAWINERFGPEFRNYIFTPQKHLLAGPDRFLIDDFETQHKKWIDHGGECGFIFGQPWNANGCGGRDGWSETKRILETLRRRS